MLPIHAVDTLKRRNLDVVAHVREAWIAVKTRIAVYYVAQYNLKLLSHSTWISFWGAGQQVGDHLLREDLDQVPANRKWQLYSGLFILLKQKPRLPDDTLTFIAQSVVQVLPTLIYGPVRTFV